MINVVCHIFGDLGVHRLGRGLVTALSRFDDIALLPVERGGIVQQFSKPYGRFLRNGRGRIEGNAGLSLGAADLAPRIVGRRKAAHVVWETTRVPAPFLDHLAAVDEVWTPSAWGRQILIDNGISGESVYVVPEGVDAERFRPPPVHPGEDRERPFRFLCVGKWEARKGIDLLVRAFGEAFDRREPAELVLHCHNPQVAGFSAPAALAALRPPAGARLSLSNPLDGDSLVELYRSCDAFVLATRGEGWGLPVIEAMACAKPVIVTDYSGHREFVNEQNGYLIRVEKMLGVDDAKFFDPALDFGEWAEPDREHLKALLHHVYENREEARHKGEIGRRQVVDSWTWDHAARKAWDRLTVMREDG